MNPDVLPRGAAASVFDTLVRFLRTGLRTVFVVAVIVAALAYLTGPSAAAVGLRRALAAGTDRIRRLRSTPGGLAGERVGAVLARTGTSSGSRSSSSPPSSSSSSTGRRPAPSSSWSSSPGSSW